jgi:LysM repeat protein
VSALAAVVLAAGTIAAAERVHVVGPGESAASLAKQYYGDKDLADLLLRFNGKAVKAVHPGDRLTIPACTVYRAKAGDTWSVLAKRALGRASASPVLAELNGSPASEPLRAGARVVLPVVLSHTLARGETLSSLAERYYGDTKKAAMVQEFNRIDDAGRLSVGAVLEIPLVAFVRAESPAAAATLLPSPAPVAAPVPTPEPPQFAGPLAEAGQSYAEGEFDHAKSVLEALGPRVGREGSASDRREWGRLMAFVYVALDRDADACAAYRASASLGTPADLDPDLVSPRIRAVLAGCPAAGPDAGQVDNPAPAPQISPHAGAHP